MGEYTDKDVSMLLDEMENDMLGGNYCGAFMWLYEIVHIQRKRIEALERTAAIPAKDEV